jgi:hypothetical protein
MRLLLTTACLALTTGAGCAAVPSAFELHAGDYERVRGEYTLADGHAIQIAGTRGHPRIEFDDGSSRPLAPLSPHEFVTTDGCTRVLFDAHANGDVTRVGVTHPRACTAR